MTSPGVGHPDGQAYALWRAPSLALVTSAPVTAATPVTVQTFLTNYASLYVSVANLSAVGVTVALNFRDGTSGPSITTYSWVLPVSGSSVIRIVPALGNNVTFTISTAQAGTATVAYRLVPLNIAPHGPVNPQPMPANFGVNTLINAASTFTQNISQVNEGFAVFTYAPKDATGQISLIVQAIAESGIQTGIVYESTLPAVTGQETTVLLASPANPLQIVATNNDVANPHHFDFAWVPNARL